MSADPLQLIIYDSTKSTSPTALCLPSIDQVTLSDLPTLKSYIRQDSCKHSFILLCMDSFDQNSDKNIIEDLRKETYIFAIYVRVKPRCNITFNSGNVFPVAKQFIAKKIASSIIRFYEILSEKLLKQDQFFAAMNYKRKVNAIKDQRRSANITIDASHILIIQMNVKEDHVYECQEELINICNNLCPEYEPTVCTLNDYFPSDENSDIYGNDSIDIKCKFIKQIAPIRLYLFGNESRNLHSLSGYLFKSEVNKIDNEYDTNYTAIEYKQPVTKPTKQFLMHVFGYSRQHRNLIFKRLEDIKNDINFAGALERVNVDIRPRARAADIELNRLAMNHTNDSIEVSGTFHIITQSSNGPVIQNSGAVEQINDAIQFNRSQSFSD